MDQNQHLKNFQKTVLRGKKPELYCLVDRVGQKKVMLHGVGSDNHNTFFLVQDSDNAWKRTVDNIREYRNIAIDIDLGGETLAEVKEKKKIIVDNLLPALPLPTCIIDTRNGYHIYYSIDNMSKTFFEIITATIKETLNGIIDSTVTADAARVLRYPYSIHKKANTDPYLITIVYSNDKIYDVYDFYNDFNSKSQNIAEVANKIKEMIPGLAKAAAKTTKKDIEYAETANDTERASRVDAIRRLSTDTFAIPAEKKTMTKQAAKQYILSQSLAELLYVNSSDSFRCVLDNHEDIHPSARITDRNRYICTCINSRTNGKAQTLDIIGVVEEIAHCDYVTAIRYLETIYNISIV